MKRITALFCLLLCAACGSSERALPAEQLDPDQLVATISHGESVELEDFLDSERWTLFDYGAEW